MTPARSCPRCSRRVGRARIGRSGGGADRTAAVHGRQPERALSAAATPTLGQPGRALSAAATPTLGAATHGATRPSLRHARAPRRLVRFHIPAPLLACTGSLPGQCIGGAKAQGPRPRAAERHIPNHSLHGECTCARAAGGSGAGCGAASGLTAEQWCSMHCGNAVAKCQGRGRAHAPVRPMRPGIPGTVRREKRESRQWRDRRSAFA